jgi:hypothetical protein
MRNTTNHTYHATVHVEGLALQEVGQLDTNEEGVSVDFDHTEHAAKVLFRGVTHVSGGRLRVLGRRLGSWHGEFRFRERSRRGVVEARKYKQRRIQKRR